MSNGNHPDPDDLFSDTRMTFGEHIEELRTHLIRALLGLVVAVIASVFFIGRPVMNTFIIEPVESQLREFYERRREKVLAEVKQKAEDPANIKPRFIEVAFSRSELAAALKGELEHPSQPPEAIEDPQSMWMRIENPDMAWVDVFDKVAARVGPQPTMKTFNITEAFVVYFKISIYCGIVFSSPWVFWQIWSFVAAGLYPHEKRYVNYYLPLSVILFLVGVLVCQFIVLPRAVSALLWFNSWLEIEPDLRLNEWLTFAISMPIVFGIAFQTPLVMLFMERLGIMNVEAFQKKRAIAFFVLSIVSALGPSIDIFSMLMMWGSLCLLYQLGIWLVQFSPRPKFDVDVPDSEEMIEV